MAINQIEILELSPQNSDDYDQDIPGNIFDVPPLKRTTPAYDNPARSIADIIDNLFKL